MLLRLKEYQVPVGVVCLYRFMEIMFHYGLTFKLSLKYRMLKLMAAHRRYNLANKILYLKTMYFNIS